MPIQYIYSENFNYGNQQYLGLTQTPTICSGECLSIDQTKVYLFFQKQPDILGNQVHSMNTIDYPSFIKIPISLKELWVCVAFVRYGDRRCIGVKWLMDQMADGYQGLVLNGRWPFGAGPNGRVSHLRPVMSPGLKPSLKWLMIFNLKVCDLKVWWSWWLWFMGTHVRGWNPKIEQVHSYKLIGKPGKAVSSSTV